MKKRKKISKKGLYYTMDSLLAGILLVGTILIISSSPFYEQKFEQKSFLSQDILVSMGELKIYELNNSFIANEISNGNITDINKTVLEQIGEYWALNKTDKATTLLNLIINESLPAELGVKISIGDEYFTIQNISEHNNVATANRMISGIEKGKPLVGSSASAYLKKVRNKKTASYSYYGRFVGQGNITTKLELPEDFDQTRLISAELKIETKGDFELYLNSNKCGTTYSGQTGGIISYWDVSSCNNSFVSGTNNISIKFDSYLNESYISGGNFKVVYTTDTLKENTTYGYKRYYFPEISGFINLYDAIAAQGLIKNWTVNISFFNEYDTFLTVGNETVFVAPGSNVTQNIVYSKTNETLSPTQIPLRLGVVNLTNITLLDTGLPADSFLVTDVSGSMNDCGEYADVEVEYCQYEYYQWWSWGWWTQCTYSGTCNDNECGVWAWGGNTRNHNIFNQTTSTCVKTLLDIAKEADKLFVETITNDSSLHKTGLVDFSSNANPYTDLTNVKEVLDTEIDTYSSGGGTCTCCGINRARTLINESGNKKFMIVLSDGEPTYKCSSFTDYTGNSGNTTENRQWAIDAGQEACAQNITVYTIGFGESMTAEGHDVMRQIACNDSLYFNATNVTQLASIYQNISSQILVAANFTSQTINVYGNFSPSHIEPDSYIDIYYNPLLTEDSQSRLSVVIETDQFNSCNASIFIEPEIIVQDSFITSYSGNQWTKVVSANGLTIFNLSEYGDDYALLGDPFTIQIPTSSLVPGAYNNISIEVGETPTNTTPCSDNNTLIYTALINSSTSRTDAKEYAEGCNWIVETDTGEFINTTVPKSYSGSNNCSYTSSSISYNSEDAYDSAVYDLLRQLDYNNDGTIFIDIEENDLEIIIITTGKIPYMWGPSIFRAEVWQ